MSAEVATTTAPTARKNDIRAILAKPETIHQLGRVATKHLTADRLTRLVLSAVNRVPKLLQCTPESILQCAMVCSQYGVEPDGRHAHLIPHGDQCTLIIDWKGLVALGRRAGVEGIVADIICVEDEFKYFRNETGTHFQHVPKFGARGDIIGAYSIVRIDGQFDLEVLTRAEIDGIRKRSRAGSNGPWVTDFGEMAKKTAIRRHSKRWPLSEEVAGAFADADDDVIEPALQPQIRKPLFTVRPEEPAPVVDIPRPVRTVEPVREEEPEDQIPGAEIPVPPPVKAAKGPRKAPKEPEPPPPAKSPVQRVADALLESQVPFQDFIDYLRSQVIYEDADSLPDVDALPIAVAEELLEHKEDLLLHITKLYGKRPE